MKKLALIASPLLAAGLYLLAGHAADAVSYLTSRQMVTAGTVSQIPAASSANGTADGVARVDHQHSCRSASSIAAGCLSSADWGTFNAKVGTVAGTAPITVSTVGVTATVACTSAGLSTAGCVSAAAQTFDGAKTFDDGIYTPTVSGYTDLLLLGGLGTLTLKPEFDHILRVVAADQVIFSASSADQVSLEVPTKSAIASRFVVKNGGGVESGYRTDFDVEAGDIDIEDGSLFVASVERIDVDGNAALKNVGAQDISAGSLTTTGLVSVGGTLTSTGAIRGNGGFRSSDGSTGSTTTLVIGTCTITIKNGLVTNTSGC